MSNEVKKYTSINPLSQNEKSNMLLDLKTEGATIFVGWSSTPGKKDETGKKVPVIDYKDLVVTLITNDENDPSNKSYKTLFRIKGFNRTEWVNEKPETVALSIEEKQRMNLFEIKDVIEQHPEMVVDALNQNSSIGEYDKVYPVLFYNQFVEIKKEINKPSISLGNDVFYNASYDDKMVILNKFNDTNSIIVLDHKNKTLGYNNIYVLNVPKEVPLYNILEEAMNLSVEEKQQFLKSNEFKNALITSIKKPRFERETSGTRTVDEKTNDVYKSKMFIYSLTRSPSQNTSLKEAIINAFTAEKTIEPTKVAESNEKFSLKQTSKKFSLNK